MYREMFQKKDEREAGQPLFHPFLALHDGCAITNVFIAFTICRGEKEIPLFRDHIVFFRACQEEIPPRAGPTFRDAAPRTRQFPVRPPVPPSG
jgi:hypothetical protein